MQQPFVILSAGHDIRESWSKAGFLRIRRAPVTELVRPLLHKFSVMHL